MSAQPLFAGIEGGGTKFVLGVGTAARGTIAGRTVPTRDPDATLGDVAAFFAELGREHAIAAVGIASFGPLDPIAGSPTYGRLLPNPKPGWSDIDLLGRVRAALGGLPGRIDTDVNAAAMAEAGAGGERDLAYVTVGTGIGAGLVVGGRPVHGIAHPEIGHIVPRRHPAHGHFAGICPFHRDCLEGLASGPAIKAAWGASLGDLPAGHPAWAAEADYLGQLAATLILASAPARIVFGGGVMAQSALLPLLRDAAARRLAGYGRGTDRAALEARIVAPRCQEAPGLIGAYLLAERAHADRSRPQSL